jgi:hypothetical protein
VIESLLGFDGRWQEGNSRSAVHEKRFNISTSIWDGQRQSTQLVQEAAVIRNACFQLIAGEDAAVGYDDLVRRGRQRRF